MPDRILLVEDDEDIREAIENILTAESLQLISASSGDEGLSLLSSEPSIGLIILDWLMPGMSGERFLAFSRSIIQSRKIPVLVISASQKAESHPDVAHFLSKPFNIDDLIFRVKELISR